MSETQDKMIEERRKRFIGKYKEAFGVEPELKPLLTDDEKLASGKYVMTLNFYDIYSPWM